MATAIASEELPNEPMFVQLLRISRQVSHVILHDASRGIDADYSQLFADLLQTRRALRNALPQSVLGSDHLLNSTSPYIFLFADGHYDFIVGAFSILSIGGAIVPLLITILADEAVHLLGRCKSSIMLASSVQLPIARKLQQSVALQGLEVFIVEISSQSSTIIDAPHSSLTISRDLTIPAHSPGILLFTSGTSGPPKGVVHRREIFYDIHTMSEPNETVLSHRSYIWIGVALPLILHPLAGARIEAICSDAPTIWKRLREGGVTKLAGSPVMWNKMMHHFKEHLQCRSQKDLDAYIRGARGLHVAHSGGGMPHPSLLRFWRDLGRPLRVGYGATELGGLGLRHLADNEASAERCIGKPYPGLTVRLSDGDHGEMQIKSPNLFMGYLDDEAATRAVFTDDGFYLTGDIAHREGDRYILDGRASQDFLRFGAYRISILEVELALQSLPFVQEGYIVPAPYPNYGALAAALVRFASPSTLDDASFEPSLRHLRANLSAKLPAYMLPTALRILHAGEEIPRTSSNKVIKSKAVEQYFHIMDSLQFPAEVEVLPFEHYGRVGASKAWDWGVAGPPL